MPRGASPRDVTVVIPCYGSAANLERHLPVLLAEQERAGFDLLVVDDASPDDSVARVRARFPGVRLVERDTNGGFGAACNSGVAAARTPLVYLANSDVEVERGFLDAALRHFEDDSVFAVSSVAVDGDGRVWDGWKGARWKRGLPRWVRAYADPATAPTGVRETFYPCGGHCLIDRARFLELGGFDVLFHPYYWEDTDLGYRAWKRGWRVLVDHASRVRHHREHSDIERTQVASRVVRIMHRNRLLFLWKNLHDRGLLWRAHLVPLLARTAFGWLALDVHWYATLGAALAHASDARAARGRAKAEARRSDRAVLERTDSLPAAARRAGRRPEAALGAPKAGDAT